MTTLIEQKLLPPSPLEPTVVTYHDAISGELVMAVKVPEFITASTNDWLEHCVRAIEKLRNELIMKYWRPSV